MLVNLIVDKIEVEGLRNWYLLRVMENSWVEVLPVIMFDIVIRTVRELNKYVKKKKPNGPNRGTCWNW